jgi:hypothetical protein
VNQMIIKFLAHLNYNVLNLLSTQKLQGIIDFNCLDLRHFKLITRSNNITILINLRNVISFNILGDLTFLFLGRSNYFCAKNILFMN